MGTLTQKKNSFLNLSPLARREALWGLFFLSPWIIGFLLFTLFPMFATLGFTFSNITQTQEEPLRWVGIENYQTILGDSQAWQSMLITVRFGLISLPVGLILPLALALLLNSKNLKGQAFFRTMFYMPYVIPFVAGVFAWGGMMNPEDGWINMGLKAIGIANPPYWTNDVQWIYFALVLMGLWGVGSSMIINLAALQGIPSELYDAARVDGAGWWATLWNVTIPMISPVIFYGLTLAIVGVFQYFMVPLVMNHGTGQPAGATLFFNLYLYKTFFTFQNMSYGATLAWTLFAVILVITGIVFKTSRSWVYYAGEGREN